MEFLKKNYLKLILAALVITGIIFTIIEMANNIKLAGVADSIPTNKDAIIQGMKAAVIVNVAVIISLSGILVALVCAMVDKKQIAHWIVFGSAVVSLIVFIVGLSMGIPALKEINNGIDQLKAAVETTPTDTLKYQLYATVQKFQTMLFGGIMNMFTYSVLPLMYGTKKLFIKE